MITIELIERKSNQREFRVIPLEDLTSDDLDWLIRLGGDTVFEIYAEDSRMHTIRKCDQSAILSDETTRVLIVRSVLMLATILRSHLSKRIHLAQLADWLEETVDSSNGEFWIRETFQVLPKPTPRSLDFIDEWFDRALADQEADSLEVRIDEYLNGDAPFEQNTESSFSERT